MKQLATSPRPIRSFRAEKGCVSVEFEPLIAEAPKEAGAPDVRPKYVPGTNVPDDKTPLNPLDTLLNVPAYDAHEVS